VSETLASLRHKIDGAAKLRSVVRTMKAVAASSIGQYTAAVNALVGYEGAVAQGLGACFRESPTNPKPRASTGRPSPPVDTRGIGAVVFGSDQGLVGQFNELLADCVTQTLAPLPGPKTLWAVGERIEGQLAASGLAPLKRFAVPVSVTAITPLVGDIQLESEAQRSRGAYVQLYLFHNRPKAGSQYEPVCQRLLPLDSEWQSSLARVAWPDHGDGLPEMLGGSKGTLRALIHEYLFISVYKACAESLASENAARLAAMQRAEKNIDELSADLRQSFYRLRQSSIDEELFDVIAGFNALT
jgi:F-type H+-transporting ATPase subunit gamma